MIKKNKFLIIFIIVSCLSSLLIISNCESGKTQETKTYIWNEISGIASGNYYTEQNGEYKCGFVTMCTWLKWVNKNYNFPDITALSNWYSDSSHGYASLVKDTGMLNSQFEKIMKEIMLDKTIVTSTSNRITVKEKIKWFDNFYADLRDSINIYSQPIAVGVTAYEGIGGQGHFILAYGFQNLKGSPKDYGEYIEFDIIDGNQPQGRRTISRSELNTWSIDGYICDNRCTN